MSWLTYWLRYAKSCGVLIAGFDFKVDELEQWYCLEMNSSPRFDSYDGVFGGAIGRALIDLLYDDG